MFMLSDKSSVLAVSYFPAVDLDDDSDYELGLTDFQMYYYIF